jgi:hypothetical protein
MNCKVCDESLGEFAHPPAVATGVCNRCRSKLGIIPMPPARRPAKPCARCNAMRFVRVVPRELSATGSDYVTSVAGPMTATLRPITEPKLVFSGKTVAEPSPSAGAGMFEMYICTGCGFVDWYCVDPENIPIGPEYMTELIDLTASSPYRG